MVSSQVNPKSIRALLTRDQIDLTSQTVQRFRHYRGWPAPLTVESGRSHLLQHDRLDISLDLRGILSRCIATYRPDDQ